MTEIGTGECADQLKPGREEREFSVAIVEDDATLREVMCDVLEDAGLRAHTASTLPNARKLLGVMRPAAIVLDLHLGDEDSVTLLGEMDREGIAVPVILISADVARLRKLPWRKGTVVVEKPFELERLVDAVLAGIPR